MEYALEFKKKKYEVILLSHPNSEITKRAKEVNLETSPIKVGSLSFLNPFKIIELIIFFQKQNIDTLIFSTSQDMKLGGLAAKIAGVNQVVYLRGLAVPVKDNIINRFFFKKILTRIVANSIETKKMLLLNLGKHISPEKIEVIYHGIELGEKKRQIKILNKINEKKHGVVLGNAGRLTEQKGQEDLVWVAKILKYQEIDFTLFIAGTGEKKLIISSLIEKLDLTDCVILLDFIEDIDSFMQSIDIFLLSSKWEGFGYVLVEAMINSKPVVAYNISSNPEIIANDETGFLVKFGDLQEFVSRTKLLITNEELRTRMGLNAKEWVEKKFNLQDRIDDFEKYLLS